MIQHPQLNKEDYPVLIEALNSESGDVVWRMLATEPDAMIEVPPPAVLHSVDTLRFSFRDGRVDVPVPPHGFHGTENQLHWLLGIGSSGQSELERQTLPDYVRRFYRRRYFEECAIIAERSTDFFGGRLIADTIRQAKDGD